MLHCSDLIWAEAMMHLALSSVMERSVAEMIALQRDFHFIEYVKTKM